VPDGLRWLSIAAECRDTIALCGNQAATAPLTARFSAQLSQEIRVASPASINGHSTVQCDAAVFAITKVELGCGAKLSGYHPSHPNRMSRTAAFEATFGTVQ
jgi:hypothetical protein